LPGSARIVPDLFGKVCKIRICDGGFEVVSLFPPFKVIVTGAPCYELAKEREGAP
jgi:hypothetical protein